ncbi:hypothetical protein HW452_02900 [Halomonas aquamarina]|uniref:Uncharacterized protein n=1 Tax=Vreelandella aquamarina TaxID=77097 RepID=A0ACC5VQG2_9GAMM|nr:hypothetical protein [Halomonas aquamarina]MBZ5486466.1 hypothetical protein [Halomonas aquamarina]
MIKFCYFEKLLPFVTAATPGGFRIFVLMLAGFFLAKDEAIFFSTEYTLAAFFVMVSGIGFSTIIIKRMPEDNSLALFVRFAYSSLLAGGSIALVLLLIASFLVPVTNSLPIFSLILTTSLYQVFRSYLVFNKSFWKLFVNDVLVAVFFVFMFLVFFLYNENIQGKHVLNLLSASYLMAFAFMIAFIKSKEKVVTKTKRKALISKEDTISSLIVGFSNATSSGVGFILPSLFVALGGSEIAIVASFAAAVFSSMSALPRGLINNKASALSTMVKDKEYSRKLVLNLKIKIRKLLFFLVPLLSIFIFSYFYLGELINDYWLVFFFILIFAFNVATGQLGVIESFLINFCGYENLSFIINLMTFLIVMLVFVIISRLPEPEEFWFILYLVPLALGVFNIARMFLYKNMIKRYFRKP